MNILEALVNLRDDLKTWVTNNILALKEEIDRSKFSGEYEDLFGKPDIDNKIEKAIESLENEVDSKLENKANKDELFSRDYNDLKNKPAIPTADELLSDEQKTQISTAYNHSQAEHAPSNAQKNSDITKAEIEAKLTGNVTSHTHSSYTTQEYVDNAVAGLVNSAPEALNTLNELAVALKNDPNHTETMLAEIGKKANSADLHKIATSGSYNDLTNKPTIPTVSNDLTNTLKSNYDTAYTHSQAAHAPSNAQKNSDITKAEIEAKLTGNITSHTHSAYATTDYVDSKLPAITMMQISQADYDALTTKDPNTLYIIV